MFNFIIPFQSKKVTENWRKQSKLCEKTIESISSQKDNDYKIHLVCHEEPANLRVKENVKIISVSYKAPGCKQEMMIDKKRKVKIGIVSTEKSIGDKFMVMDADDRVSNRLVEVSESIGGGVQIIRKGYVWPHKSAFVFKWKILSKPIFEYDGKNLPSSVTDDEEYLILKPHNEVGEKAEKGIIEAKEIPMHSYLYVVDTEDNHSGASFRNFFNKKNLFGRLLGVRVMTKSVKEEFCVV